MSARVDTLPKNLATLAAGMLFGFGLSLSSMIQPEVVLNVGWRLIVLLVAGIGVSHCKVPLFS